MDGYPLTIIVEMTRMVPTTADTMYIVSHRDSSASFWRRAASSALTGLFFSSAGGFCDGKMLSMNCSICKPSQFHVEAALGEFTFPHAMLIWRKFGSCGLFFF